MIRHGGEMGIDFENRQDRSRLLVLRGDASPAEEPAKAAECESCQCYAGDGAPIHVTGPLSTERPILAVRIVHLSRRFTQFAGRVLPQALVQRESQPDFRLRNDGGEA